MWLARGAGSLAPAQEIVSSKMWFRGEGWGEGPALIAESRRVCPSPNLSPQRHAGTKSIRSGERDQTSGLPALRCAMSRSPFMRTGTKGTNSDFNKGGLGGAPSMP
jgi:hypothetical protein